MPHKIKPLRHSSQALLLCLVLIIHPLKAWSELVIRVTQGNDQPTMVAVPPMVMSGNQLVEDISAIVESDLQRSGLFKTIPRENMLAFPSHPEDVYFRDWRLLGSEYLIVGSLSAVEEGGVELSFSLLDVNAQKTVFKHSVKGSKNQLRDLAHLASDKIYEEITGIRGAFSTRLAYVTADQKDGRLVYQLNVADSDGARERVMLKSAEPIMSPAWSPKGDELAYVSFETGRPAIFRQSLTTAARKQLTNFRGLNGAPSWSPDGKQFALVLSKDGNPEIYILDLESSKFARMTCHFAIDT